MNRFEEDYNNLNSIYKRYFTEDYTPKMAGGQQAAQQGTPSFRKGDLPLAVPGNGGNAYAMNSLPNSTTPVSDEEDDYISKKAILNKIEEMVEEARSAGMDYAIYQLTSLQKFIRQ